MREDGRSASGESPVPAGAGLSFCPGPRSDSGMEESLERVIRQALADAEATGRDYLTQTELAVRAVRQVRPDMTASEALTAVEMVQQRVHHST